MLDSFTAEPTLLSTRVSFHLVLCKMSIMKFYCLLCMISVNQITTQHISQDVDSDTNTGGLDAIDRIRVYCMLRILGRHQLNREQNDSWGINKWPPLVNFGPQRFAGPSLNQLTRDEIPTTKLSFDDKEINQIPIDHCYEIFESWNRIFHNFFFNFSGLHFRIARFSSTQTHLCDSIFNILNSFAAHTRDILFSGLFETRWSGSRARNQRGNNVSIVRCWNSSLTDSPK